MCCGVHNFRTKRRNWSRKTQNFGDVMAYTCVRVLPRCKFIPPMPVSAEAKKKLEDSNRQQKSLLYFRGNDVSVTMSMILMRHRGSYSSTPDSRQLCASDVVRKQSHGRVCDVSSSFYNNYQMGPFYIPTRSPRFAIDNLCIGSIISSFTLASLLVGCRVASIAVARGFLILLGGFVVGH
uniref:Uncharacterized protein n=2 Tax=Lotharella oceanica TaxID=641309 RepID=A0A7S2TP15_9EUKA|mmetsp:Transcript_23172/g.43437  ORF Transcript_23172/g.43437 Transcript_23172/m.43437 type:complete len:180 (+) Transcript_23172:59-598(+)